MKLLQSPSTIQATDPWGLTMYTTVHHPIVRIWHTEPYSRIMSNIDWSLCPRGSTAFCTPATGVPLKCLLGHSSQSKSCCHRAHLSADFRGRLLDQKVVSGQAEAAVVLCSPSICFLSLHEASTTVTVHAGPPQAFH